MNTWLPGGVQLGAPWMVALGAAVAGAILLLHLVRPRPRRLLVSSLLLWRMLQERVREQSLLRRLIPTLLLMLQMAAAVLLGVSLAWPRWKSAAPLPPTGVFVVDRSLSMQALEPSGDRFTLAKQALARVLSGDEAVGLHRIYVGGLGPGGVELLGPFSSAGRAREALEKVPAPSDGQANFTALRRQLEAVAAGGEPVRLWFATDGVMTREEQGQLLELGRSLSLKVVTVGTSGPPNAAITAMKAYAAGSGDPADLQVMVEVSNFAGQPLDGVLNLQGDFNVNEVRPVHLEPGRSTRLVFSYRVQGLSALRARLDPRRPDALAADNEAALVFSDPLDPVIVYLVGEPTEALRRAVTAAGHTALFWIPGAGRGESSTPALLPGPLQGPALATGPGRGYPGRGAHLVIFNGVEPPGAPDRAEGDRATGWTAPLWWVVPPKASGSTAGAGPDEPVVFWKRTHPLLRFVDLEGVRVRRSPAAPTVPDSADVLVAGSRGPLLWEWVDAHGQRRLESGFALEESNLPGRIAFAVLVANLVRSAAPHSWQLAQPPLLPGQPAPLRLPPGEKELLVLTPDGRVVRHEARASAVPPFALTERAGVYQAWPASGSAENPVAMWAVQTPGAGESDLRRTGSLPGAAEPTSARAPARAELPLWRYTVGLALALMAAEGALYLMASRLPRSLSGRLPPPAGPGTDLASWARRRRLFCVLRAAGLAALAAALVNPLVPWPSWGRRLVFVLDTSYSLPLGARAQAEAFIRRVVHHLRARDRAWLIEAGERPRLVAAYVGPRVDPSGPLAPPTGGGGESTDLESALLAASSLLAPPESTGRAGGAQGRIVLISDGRETAGSVLEAVHEAAGQLPGGSNDGATPFPPVDVIPVLAASRPEVAVSALTAPLSAAKDGSVRLTARLYASERKTAQVRLERNGHPIWEGSVDLPAGWSTLGFEDRPGTTSGSVAVYSLRLRAEGDTHPQNDRADVAVSLRGQDRVLYVSDDPPDRGGSRWLGRSAGITVETLPPDRLPASRAELAGFSALVLDNVPADRLTRTQMEAVAAFVRDLGGGLVVLGGPQAFGPGGYRSTPLEEVLPVWADVPARLVVPQVALVLVIDKSGSMGEQEAAGTKLDAARRAAAATLELLSPTDLVGVLAFDAEPRWVQPLQAASDPAGIMRRLAQLAADGGTELGPALREALDALRTTRAMVRHAIVLSDGKSTAADFEAMTTRAASEGITVSTVAVGQDADVSLLADIARWGKGRFYYTRDMRRVPQIFASETMTVTRSALVTTPVDVVATAPAGAGEGPLSPGIRKWPRLLGYVATTPKPAASVYLAAPDGDPILATWRVGLGRVAAFTSSLTGPWGQAWQDQALAGPVLARMVRWVMSPAPASSSQLVAELEGDAARVVAEVLDPDGRPVNFLEGTAVISSPSGRPEEVAMVQEGPGRYTARFDAAQPGEYVVTARLGGLRLQTVVVRSYAAEFEPGPASPALLASVARVTGGRVLGYITDSRAGPLSPELAAAADSLASPQTAAPRGWEARPAWPILVVAALALLLGDVAARQLNESPWALAADARAALALLGPAVRRQVQLLVRPSPAEVERARHAARGSRFAPAGRSPDAGDAGVDPARAARLYLARLRRERRR